MTDTNDDTNDNGVTNFWKVAYHVSRFDHAWQAGEDFGFHDTIGGSEYRTALANHMSNLTSLDVADCQGMADSHADWIVSTHVHKCDVCD